MAIIDLVILGISVSLRGANDNYYHLIAQA